MANSHNSLARGCTELAVESADAAVSSSDTSCQESDFTSDAPSPDTPFQEPDFASDVALIVEDRKLHVHRTVLALYSPVFQRMFYSEFREKEAGEVKLPGKHLDSVVPFLMQMYPVHSLEPIKDEILVEILALADEYQVEHIKLKCDRYVEAQLHSQEALSTDQVLLYLWMCEQYNLAQHRDDLLNLAAGMTTKQLEASLFYANVPATAMKDVFLRRCAMLEEENSSVKAQAERFKNDWQTQQKRADNAQASVDSLNSRNRDLTDSKSTLERYLKQVNFGLSSFENKLGWSVPSRRCDKCGESRKTCALHELEQSFHSQFDALRKQAPT